LKGRFSSGFRNVAAPALLAVVLLRAHRRSENKTVLTVTSSSPTHMIERGPFRQISPASIPASDDFSQRPRSTTSTQLDTRVFEPTQMARRSTVTSRLPAHRLRAPTEQRQYRLTSDAVTAVRRPPGCYGSTALSHPHSPPKIPGTHSTHHVQTSQNVPGQMTFGTNGHPRKPTVLTLARRAGGGPRQLRTSCGPDCGATRCSIGDATPPGHRFLRRYTASCCPRSHTARSTNRRSG
jgi:hypothetical protein